MLIVELDAEFLERIPPPGRVIEFRDARAEFLILRVEPSGALAYYTEGLGTARVCIGRPSLVSLETARSIAGAYARLVDAKDGYAEDLRTLEAWERVRGPLAAN